MPLKVPRLVRYDPKFLVVRLLLAALGVLATRLRPWDRGGQYIRLVPGNRLDHQQDRLVLVDRCCHYRIGPLVRSLHYLPWDPCLLCPWDPKDRWFLQNRLDLATQQDRWSREDRSVRSDQ